MAILVQFELQHLAVLELAELLGLLAAGQDIVDRIGRQAYLGKQRGQRIATGHGDFAMAWLLGFRFLG
ncbi:hypothetical protein D9M71_743920 [compost metagenome]